MGKYHLPDGETLVTDLQCLVVYTPADPDYRQALWGAISQLTKFWMWEPDGAGGEHDAADSWDLAYAATLESFGMLEELLQSVDEVEPLLRQLQVQQMCCDQMPGGTDIIAESESDGATSTTDVSGGVFPDGIADENEWDPYICNAATALVDRLIEAPDYLTQFASLTISLITAIALWYIAGAYIAIAGAIGGILTRLDIFDIIDVFENLVAGIDGETEDPPGQVASKLQAIRDDLICDIVQANDADSATALVNARIGDTTISTAWKNIFLLFFTNQYIMATVFNGDADEAPSADCSACEPWDFDNTYTFDTDEEGWNLGSSRVAYNETEDALVFTPKSTQGNGTTNKTRAAFASDAGVQDDAFKFRHFSFTLRNWPPNSGDPFADGKTVEAVINYADGSQDTQVISEFGDHTIFGDVSKVLVGGSSPHCIEINAFHNGSGSDNWIVLDDIRVAGDAG